MKKKMAMLLVFFMFVSIMEPLFGVIKVQASSYLDENFNVYASTVTDLTAVAPSGWGKSNFTAEMDYTVAESVYYGESANSVKFVSKTNSKYVQIYKSFTSSNIVEKVQLDAKVMFEDTTHDRLIFDLNTLTTDKITLVSFNKTGKIAFGGVESNEDYEANTWYNIKIVLDSSAKQMDIYINNSLKAQLDSTKFPTDFKGITYLRIGQKGLTGTTGVMYLDDVLIRPYAEVTPTPTSTPTPTPTVTPTPSATPTPTVTPTPTPSNGYVEFMNTKFDNYVGPTVMTTTSVKVEDMKGYNVINNVNYMTDAIIEGKPGKSLKVISNNADIDVKKPINLTKEFSQPIATKTLTIATNVMFEDNNHYRDVFTLRNIGNVAGVTPQYATLFSFTAEGQIKIYGKDSNISYQPNTWYNLVVHLDIENETIKYYINGQEIIVTGTDKLPAKWGSLFSIKYSQVGISGNPGVMYLDDIKVFTGTEPSEGQDIPVEKNIDGWDVRYISGIPSVSENLTPNIITNKSIKVLVPTVIDKASFKKVLSVTGGKTYVLDMWVKVDTLSAIKINSIVIPQKNGQNLKNTSGEDIKYLSQNNARGEDIKTEIVRVRTYFEAPVDADTILVEHLIPGPSTTDILKVELQERPEWQDVIGKYNSNEIAHPNSSADITKMFLGWQWTPIAADTDDIIMQALDPIMNMTEAQLIQVASNNAKTRNYLDVHPIYESNVRRLAYMYNKTGDEAYARRAIIIMNEFAKSYKDVPRLIIDNDLFHAHGKYMPMECIYAYDLIYNSNEWNKLAQETGKEVRIEIESWFRTSFMNMYNLHNDVYYSNITPYGIRNAMGLAVVLNDPDIIRLMIPWMDTMFSGKQFHADGMWQEGAIAYGMQVTNNCLEGLNLLASCYKDPEGYVDTKFGIKLNYTNIKERWPLLVKSATVGESMKYPNGSTVGLHDTWTKGQRPGDLINKVTDLILPQYLNNVELWHFGHFALTRGDESDATQVRMSFPPLAEGLPYMAGHYHGNHLGITLWGAGMEMLPDSGYPKGPYRYFNMDTQSHNAAWVWNKDAKPYAESNSKFVRPSLLAYDPGTRSNKQVQLMEASSPGPVADLTEMKRRLLLMIGTEGNKSYVLDLQRLKGGQAHELFMHASEDEDSDLTTSLSLEENNGINLDQYMKKIGHEEGLTNFRYMFKDPKVASGTDDFKFVWKGQDSGSSMQVFMNGIEDSEAIFTRAPSNRRTQNDPKFADSYPAWNFYRRNLVTTDEVTKFGAVYETYRDKQTPIVNNVTWKPSPDGDQMTTLAIIDMGSYVDKVYISDDTTEREIDGVKYAGKVAILRQNKASGEYTWGYVYGQGHITTTNFIVQGEQDLIYQATETTGSLDNSTANTVKLDKELPRNKSLNGVWLIAGFSDKSGYGMKINSANQDTLQVNDIPAFTISPTGAKMSFFPSLEQPDTNLLNLHSGDQEFYIPREIPGKVSIEIRQPIFKINSTDSSDDNSSGTGGNTNIPSDIISKDITSVKGETESIVVGEIKLNSNKPGNEIELDEIALNQILAYADDTIKKAQEVSDEANTFKPSIRLTLGNADNTINGKMIVPSKLVKEFASKGIEDIDVSIGKASIKVKVDVLDLKDAAKVIFIVEDAKDSLTSVQKDIVKDNKVYNLEILGQASDGNTTKIQPSNGALKISIPYTLSGSEDIKKLTVFYISDDGKLENKAARYNSVTQTMEFYTTHLSKYFVKENIISFNDVDNQHWAKVPVEVLAAKGIINGVGEKQFNPEDKITRAEFTKLLTLLLMVKEDNIVPSLNDKYMDVEENSWYLDYIYSAKKVGLIKGRPDGTFGPNDYIDRQDAAVILSRVLELYYNKKAGSNTEILNKFKDISSADGYAINPLTLVVENSLLTGQPDGTINPKGQLTRAEAATIIYRLISK